MNNPRPLFGWIVALSALGLVATAAFANEEELAAIEKRAAEIAPMLADAPNYGARATDRAFWAERASSEKGAAVVKEAEELTESPLPDLTEELYKEFYKNGVRSNYQEPFYRLHRRVSILAMAEVLENKRRFVRPFEEALSYLCELPSWVLPAHDTNAEVYDGKNTYADLGATLTGGEVGAAYGPDSFRYRFFPTFGWGQGRSFLGNFLGAY